MNQVRDIIYRLQRGQSERQIARDLHVSRVTVNKYRQMAKEEGYLDENPCVPGGKELLAKLGPAKAPPRAESGAGKWCV